MLIFYKLSDLSEDLYVKKILGLSTIFEVLKFIEVILFIQFLKTLIHLFGV